MRIKMKINKTLAKYVTLAMGSMWCAYALFALALIPLEWPSTMQVVTYISSAVIQLVALPIIMVGNQVLSEASEKRAKQDHAMLMESHAEIHELLREVRLLMKKEGIEV